MISTPGSFGQRGSSALSEDKSARFFSKMIHNSSRFYVLLSVQTSGMFESNKATLNSFKRLLQSQYISQRVDNLGSKLTHGDSEMAEDDGDFKDSSHQQKRIKTAPAEHQRASGASEDETSGPQGSGHLIDTAAVYLGYNHAKKSMPVQIHSEIIERRNTLKGSGEEHHHHHVLTEGHEQEPRHYHLKGRVNGAFSDSTIRRNHLRSEQDQPELAEGQPKTVKSNLEER